MRCRKLRPNTRQHLTTCPDLPKEKACIRRGVHTRPVKAVIHSGGTMIHTPTGQNVEFETLDVLTIADGKIIDFLEFFDTHRLAQVIGGVD